MLDVDTLTQLLQTHLPQCQLQIEGDGHHFQAIIVGDIFEGKNRVQRQQLVYAAVNDMIQSGDLHALSIKTYTTTEWTKLNG